MRADRFIGGRGRAIKIMKEAVANQIINTNNSMAPTILLSLLVVVLLIGSINFQNLFNRLKINANNSSIELEAKMKNRQELVISLIELERAYAHRKSEVFAKVLAALALVETASVHSKDSAEVNLSKQVQELLLILGKRSELKTPLGFIDLEAKLILAESEVIDGRKLYNVSAREYNKRVKRFPTNIYAKIFSSSITTFPEVSDGEPSISIIVSFKQ